MPSAADTAQDGHQFWRVNVVVWADAEQLNRLNSDIQHTLCPDPDHEPPCPIPWEIGVEQLAASDPDVDSLRAQVAAETAK